MKQKLVDRTGLIVLAAAFIAFVALNQWLFHSFRLDLTENKIYSVSDGTQKILQSLDNEVVLDLFFSKSVMKDNPQIKNYAQRVTELLQEYVGYSDGNLVLNIIDPEPFSEAEDAAAANGLQKIPGPGGDDWFLGLVVRNGDKKEVLPFLHPERERFLEHEVSQAIYKAAQEKMPVVGLIDGLQINGGFDFIARRQKEAWTSIEQLKQLYQIKSLSGDEENFDGIDLLMVVQPSNMSEKARYAIDQYVLGGGKVIMFVDPVADSARQSSNPMAAQGKVDDLNMLFEQWGFKIDLTKVLADKANAYAVQPDPRKPAVPHLGLIGFHQPNFDSEDIIMADLENVNWGTSGVIEALENSDITFRPLMTSSAESALLDADKFAMLTDPKTLLDGFEVDDKQYVVAASVSGLAKTAYPNGIPQVSTDAEESDEEGESNEANLTESDEVAESSDSETSEYVLPENHLVESKQPFQLLIIADTDILTDGMWVQVQNFFGQRMAQAFADNGSFLINSVDTMLGSKDLIGLRSRGQYSRPFERVEALRAKAGEAFLAKEAELQQQLTETENQLAELESSVNDKGELTLTPEQEQALVDFQHQKLRIRKELRNVRHQLDKDIQQLGGQLKFLNTLAVPIMLIVFAVAIARSRRRLRAQLSQ